MVQVVIETELREEAARAVALDAFTVIAAAEADEPENGRVATVTPDGSTDGLWWGEIVEDVPSFPPEVVDRGRWGLSLTGDTYVRAPGTVVYGVPCSFPTEQRTAGVYTILDNPP